MSMSFCETLIQCDRCLNSKAHRRAGAATQACKCKTNKQCFVLIFTCRECWRLSHSRARHTQRASLLCGRGRGSSGCRMWGRPCRSPAGCTQTCIHRGASSDACAGFPPCCRCAYSPRTCIGIASPERQKEPMVTKRDWEWQSPMENKSHHSDEQNVALFVKLLYHKQHFLTEARLYNEQNIF